MTEGNPLTGAERPAERVSEVLERVYDELDGIAGGEVPEDLAFKVGLAMAKVEEAKHLAERLERERVLA